MKIQNSFLLVKYDDLFNKSAVLQVKNETSVKGLKNMISKILQIDKNTFDLFYKNKQLIKGTKLDDLDTISFPIQVKKRNIYQSKQESPDLLLSDLIGISKGNQNNINIIEEEKNEDIFGQNPDRKIEIIDIGNEERESGNRGGKHYKKRFKNKNYKGNKNRDYYIKDKPKFEKSNFEHIENKPEIVTQKNGLEDDTWDKVSPEFELLSKESTIEKFERAAQDKMTEEITKKVEEEHKKKEAKNLEELTKKMEEKLTIELREKIKKEEKTNIEKAKEEILNKAKTDIKNKFINFDSLRDKKIKLLERLELINKDLSKFYCPISQELFVDPVICSDGRTYERIYIEDWLKTQKTSPITIEILQNNNIKPNYEIKTLIADKKTEKDATMKEILEIENQIQNAIN